MKGWTSFAMRVTKCAPRPIRWHAKAHGIPLIMETSDRGMIDIERYDEADTPFLHGRISDAMLEAMRNASAWEQVFDAFIDVSQASERGVAVASRRDDAGRLASIVYRCCRGAPMRPKSSEAFFSVSMFQMLAITWNGMSSSLNPSIDRARQAERIAQAEVHVFRADQHADICHELWTATRRCSGYGIKKLTTFNRDWIGNPNVIVIAALGKGTGVDGRSRRVLGGARMHGAQTVDQLPLMKAIGGQDSRLGGHMEQYVEEGAFELGGCGTALEMAGMGVEATFMIRRPWPPDHGRWQSFCADFAGHPAHAKAARVLHRKGHRGRWVFHLPHAQTAASTIARYTFPEQLEDVQPEVRALLEGIWQDPRRHGAPGARSQRGVEPQIQTGSVMTIATRTRQWRAVRIGVHGGGYSRCSTIAHRKAWRSSRTPCKPT